MLRETKKNSLYDFDAEVDSSDHLISLITCTRYFGLNGKTQFRIDAREVRKNEKIKKYSGRQVRSEQSVYISYKSPRPMVHPLLKPGRFSA